MKKLVLMFVAIAAISFASCGNNTKAGDNTDSVEVSVDSLNDSIEVADSVAGDSVQ